MDIRVQHIRPADIALQGGENSMPIYLTLRTLAACRSAVAGENKLKSEPFLRRLSATVFTNLMCITCMTYIPDPQVSSRRQNEGR